jgi:hypothetical protein
MMHRQAIPRLSLLLPALLALLCAHVIVKASYRLAVSEIAVSKVAASEVVRALDGGADGESPSSSSPRERTAPSSRDDSATPPEQVPLLAVRSDALGGAIALDLLSKSGTHPVSACSAPPSPDGLDPALRGLERAAPFGSLPQPAWAVNPPFAPRAPPFSIAT